MKNVEFYHCASMSLCEIAAEYRGEKSCAPSNCEKCTEETATWLLEEHVTEWSKVTPFVPVRAKDVDGDYWYTGLYFISYHKLNDIEYFVVSNTPNIVSAGKNFTIFDCCRLASEFND